MVCRVRDGPPTHACLHSTPDMSLHIFCTLLYPKYNGMYSFRAFSTDIATAGLSGGIPIAFSPLLLHSTPENHLFPRHSLEAAAGFVVVAAQYSPRPHLKSDLKTDSVKSA